jgi:phage-related protein
VSPKDKPLVWLSGEVKTPPFSKEARVEAGFLLRLLQAGQSLSMPHSRPMPVIGARCHELRIQDADRTWRVVYRVDTDAVVIADVFAKTSQTTPAAVIENSKRRLRAYDVVVKG